MRPAASGAEAGRGGGLAVVLGMASSGSNLKD